MSTTPFKIRRDVPPPRMSGQTNEYGEVYSALMELQKEEVGASFFIPCELEKCEALRKNIGVKMTKIRKRGPEFRDYFVTTAKVVENVDGREVQGISVWKVYSAAHEPGAGAATESA